MNNDGDERVSQFLDAVLERRGGEARSLLLTFPDVASFSVHTAAAAGDVEALSRFVREDPAAATTPYGKMQVPPIVFAAGSPLHEVSPVHAAAFLEIVRHLLDTGASANSGSLFFGDSEEGAPISVLYFAIMSNHLGIVALLLERGARTQDGESIYHAAQHNRRDCLDLLAKFGADFSARQSPYGNTPLYFLAGHRADDDGRAAWAQGVKWLLDHGADPNVASGDDQSTPLHMLASGGRQQVLEWVVEAGGDVNALRADGRTPYGIALRSGNLSGAAFLRARGASDDTVSTIDRFLGAVHDGREDEFQTLLAATPDLISSLSPDEKGALSDAVRNDNLEAIERFVALGFDLGWEESEGGTPLHTAAWLGKVDLVRALIALGAPVNHREHQFGSSPVGWTAHGSGLGLKGEFPRAGMGTDDDYCAIIDLLADAGATREASINKWNEPPENMASKRVKAKLIERGLA